MWHGTGNEKAVKTSNLMIERGGGRSFIDASRDVKEIAAPASKVIPVASRPSTLLQELAKTGHLRANLRPNRQRKNKVTRAPRMQPPQETDDSRATFSNAQRREATQGGLSMGDHMGGGLNSGWLGRVEPVDKET
jgi:hypothetical protein